MRRKEKGLRDEMKAENTTIAKTQNLCRGGSLVGTKRDWTREGRRTISRTTPQMRDSRSSQKNPKEREAHET